MTISGYFDGALLGCRKLYEIDPFLHDFQPYISAQSRLKQKYNMGEKELKINIFPNCQYTTLFMVNP